MHYVSTNVCFISLSTPTLVKRPCRSQISTKPKEYNKRGYKLYCIFVERIISCVAVRNQPVLIRGDCKLMIERIMALSQHTCIPKICPIKTNEQEAVVWTYESRENDKVRSVLRSEADSIQSSNAHRECNMQLEKVDVRFTSLPCHCLYLLSTTS